MICSIEFVPRIAIAPGRVCQYSDVYVNIPAADNEAECENVVGSDMYVSSCFSCVLVRS